MSKRFIIIAAILSLSFFSPLLSQDTTVVSIISVFKDGLSSEEQQKLVNAMKDVLAGNAGITVSDTILKQPDFLNELTGREDASLFSAYADKQVEYLILAEYIPEPDSNEPCLSDSKTEEDEKSILSEEIKKEAQEKEEGEKKSKDELQQESRDEVLQEPEKRYSLILYLYSLKDRSFVYISSNKGIVYSALAAETAILGSRAAMFISGTLPLPGPITISESEDKNELKLNWAPEVAGDTYEVQRSCYTDGPFETIAKIQEGAFSDLNIDPGVVYYYRVRGYRGDIPGDFTETVRAYKRLPIPDSEDIQKIIKAKKNKIPVSENIDQQELEKKYGEILTKFYIKPFYVGFILNILKQSIKKYDLSVLRGTGDYIIDRTNRTIYIVDRKSYVIKFYSKRLFKLYDQVPAGADPVVLSFGKGGNSRDRLIKGWGWEADDHIWNNADYVELRMPLKKYPSGTELNFHFAGTRKYDDDSIQRAIVSINGIKLTEFEVQRDGRYRVVIPSDFPVDEGEVVMGMELPNIHMRQTGSQERARSGLAVSLKEISISEYNENQDLFKKLMNNAVVFCVLRGEKEIVLDDGTRKVLPLYEAMGLATEYYKDLKDWKKHALIFASSDEEIQEKIKQERQNMGR